MLVLDLLYSSLASYILQQKSDLVARGFLKGNFRSTLENCPSPLYNLRLGLYFTSFILEIGEPVPRGPARLGLRFTFFLSCSVTKTTPLQLTSRTTLHFLLPYR